MSRQLESFGPATRKKDHVPGLQSYQARSLQVHGIWKEDGDGDGAGRAAIWNRKHATEANILGF